MARSKKPRERKEKVRKSRRSIAFYRAVPPNGEDGKPIKLPVKKILEHIKTLPYREEGEPTAYTDIGEGDVMACWIDAAELPARVRIGKIRRGVLPPMESGGVFDDLPIPDKAGLAELAHLMIFPGPGDMPIIGAEINVNAPRASRLARYWPEKAPDLCPRITVDQLIRGDAMRKLNRFAKVTEFTLQVRPSWGSHLADASRNVAQMLSAAKRGFEPEAVTITMGRQPYGRRAFLPSNTLDFLKKALREGEIHQGAWHFEAKGIEKGTGSEIFVDLLRDRLVSERDIPLAPGRSRRLDSAAAYNAIEDAYRELKDEIDNALGVS